MRALPLRRGHWFARMGRKCTRVRELAAGKAMSDVRSRMPYPTTVAYGVGVQWLLWPMTCRTNQRKA